MYPIDHETEITPDNLAEFEERFAGLPDGVVTRLELTLEPDGRTIAITVDTPDLKTKTGINLVFVISKVTAFSIVERPHHHINVIYDDLIINFVDDEIFLNFHGNGSSIEELTEITPIHDISLIVAGKKCYTYVADSKST